MNKKGCLDWNRLHGGGGLDLFMTSYPASWEATSQGWAESISVSNALCRWAGEIAHRTLGTQGRAV